MKLAITAATSQLGQLVIHEHLEKGLNGRDLVAIVRNPEKAAPMAIQGIEIRKADYSDSKALHKALIGVDKVLLISGLDPERAAQHRNVIEAARAARVKLLVYTSILKADSSKLLLAIDHRATETMILESGLPYVFLRNSWYIENYTANLGQTLAQGAIFGSAGEAKVSAASRADYAVAAAAVLTQEGHVNKIYELGGDEAFSMADLAATISRETGKAIKYNNMPLAEYQQMLVSVGVPEGFAALLADGDRGLAEGELYTNSRDLRQLIGRPTTALNDVLEQTLHYLY